MRDIKKKSTWIVFINVLEKCVYFSRSVQQDLAQFNSYILGLHT